MTMRGNPMAYMDPTGNFNIGIFFAGMGAGLAAGGGVGLALGVLFAPVTGGMSLIAAGIVIGAVSGAAGGLASTSANYALSDRQGKNWAEYMRDGGWQDVAVGGTAGAVAGGVGAATAARATASTATLSIGQKSSLVAANIVADAGVSTALGAGQEYYNTGSVDGKQLLVNSAINLGLSIAPMGLGIAKGLKVKAGEEVAPLLSETNSSSCFVAGTLVWVRRRKVDGSSRFFAEMFSQYDIIELEVEGQMHEIILLPIEMIEIGDEVLSMPEDYRPELDQVA